MDIIDRNGHIEIWEWIDSNPGKMNSIETILEEFAGGTGESEDDIVIAVAYLVEHRNLVMVGEGGVKITDECKRAEPAG